MAEGKAGSKAGSQKTCLFCAIVAGTEKSFPVFRDETFLAFLDYRPLAIGHVLLVPIAHYPTLADAPDEAMAGLAVRAKRLSKAIMRAMNAEGSFLALNNVVSQSVPHVHLHIVPRRKGDGVFSAGYIWKRASYRDDAEREDVAGRIRGALADSS